MAFLTGINEREKKLVTDNNIRISIVTVCKNAEKTIRATVESVLNQTYTDFEYYIIDGTSDDNTLSIIKEYSSDNRLHIVSEVDSGIYNAMNNSLNYISGEYVLFLNSGDLLSDDCVLEDIAPFLSHDIVYGDVYRKTESGGYLQRYRGGRIEILILLLCGTVMCHQAIFTKTFIMREYRFNEIYAVAADHEFIARALKDRRDIYHVRRTICVYDNEGGVSANPDNQDWIRKEVDNSLKSILPAWYYIIKCPKGLFRIVRKLMGRK